MNDSQPHLVEIYDGVFFDAHVLKSMLEDSDIEVYVFDDNMGVIAPWNVAAGGAGAVRLLVSSDKEVSAKAIVREFEASLKSD